MSSSSSREWSRGRWLTQRQRCQIASKAPPRPEQSATVSDVVPNLLRDLKIEDRFWQEQIRRDWEIIAGLQLARHTRAGEVLRDRTLVVYVENSVWLQELSRTAKPLLLRKLQERFGAEHLSGVIFRLDPEPPARRPPPAATDKAQGPATTE